MFIGVIFLRLVFSLYIVHMSVLQAKVYKRKEHYKIIMEYFAGNAIKKLTAAFYKPPSILINRKTYLI